MEISTPKVADYSAIRQALNSVGCSVFLDTIDPSRPIIRTWPTPSQWVKAQALLPDDLPLEAHNSPRIFPTPKLAVQYAHYLGCLMPDQAGLFTTIPDGDGWSVVWHEDAILV